MTRPRRFQVARGARLAALVMVVLASSVSLAEEARTPDELLEGFLAAVENHSYEDMVAPFVVQGPEIAAGVASIEAEARLQLDALTEALGPRLSQGYTTVLPGSAQAGGLRDLSVEARVLRRRR